MHKKLYKAKKNWVIGLIAGALLVLGGNLSAHAATNFSNPTAQPAISANTQSTLAASQQGLNLYDQGLVGVTGNEPSKLNTARLNANVNVSTRGDVYDLGSYFPRTINGSHGQLTNRGKTSYYYYYNHTGSRVDYLPGQDTYQQPVTSASIVNGYLSKTTHGNPAQVVESNLGHGTLSTNNLHLVEQNTAPLPHPGDANQVTLNRHVTTQGNTVTNTIDLSIGGNVVQPGALGIKIEPDWYINNQINIYHQDDPYVLGNCFYYIIKNVQGTPLWVEVIQPLNGTRMFAANPVGTTVDPILGGRKLDRGAEDSQLFMTAPAGLNAHLAYRESYFEVGNFNYSDMNHYGNLDSYTLGENSQGQPTLHVSGWQASNTSLTRPNNWLILFDNTTGREVQRVHVTSALNRADVNAAFPQVVNSYQSGFNADFTLPTTSLGHQFSIVARFSDNANTGEGNHNDLWLHPFTFNQGNFANLDGLKVINGHLQVNGWQASNQAANKPYHYIIVLSNGVEVGRTLVNNGQTRPDVANVYGTIFNAQRSGFAVNLPLTANMASGNLQVVSRWTADPAGNGNGTDYWFTPVNLNDNRGNLDGATVNGHQLTVAGWNATDAALIDQHHTLILFDNTTNREVSRIQVTNIDRPDVAHVFPGIQTAGQSGFTGTFNNVTLQADHRYSLVSRYSFTNDSNHHFVDHWFNLPAGIHSNQSSIDPRRVGAMLFQVTYNGMPGLERFYFNNNGNTYSFSEANDRSSAIEYHIEGDTVIYWRASNPSAQWTTSVQSLTSRTLADQISGMVSHTF